MRVGQTVKLTKLEASKSFKYKTPSWEEFEKEDESIHSASIPNSYWVIGKLLILPEVNSCILLERSIRNGVVADGIFRTSVIKDIKYNGQRVIFETENSVYLLEKMDN
jgi:hypothetical protein